MRTTTKCSHCRRRKHKCVHDGAPPCSYCKTRNLECTLTVLENSSNKALSDRKVIQSNAVHSNNNTSNQQFNNAKRLKLAKNISPVNVDPKGNMNSDIPGSDPTRYIPSQTLITAFQRIIELFPEFLFLHKGSLLEDPFKMDDCLRNALLAMLGKYAPLKGDEFLSAESTNVVEERYSKFAISNILSNLALLNEPKLEVVQVLLILATYEWNSSRTFGGWMLFGNATRMLQALDLNSLKEPASKQKMLPFDRELLIRTFWSSFILDKTFSSGKNKAIAYSKEDLEGMPLPKLQHEFELMSPSANGANTNNLESAVSHNVDTRSGQGFSSDNNQLTLRDFDFPTKETAFYLRTSNGTLILYLLKIYEIWGDITFWLARGGRRKFLKHPWDPESEYYRIDRSTRVFIDLLPPNYSWGIANYSNQVAFGNHMTYSLINVLLRLSIIFIRREYIPFLPHSTVRPMGPQEEPILPAPPIPNFWEISAAELHDSGRELADIVSFLELRNQEIGFKGVPMISYGCFTSAAVLLYAHKFYWMDSIMDKSKTENALNRMMTLLEVKANSGEWELLWLKTVKHLQQLYDIVCSDLNRARRLQLGRDSFIKIEDSIQTVNSSLSSATSDLEKLNQKLDSEQKAVTQNEFTGAFDFLDTLDLNSDFFNGFLTS